MLARDSPQAKIAFTGGDAGILYKSDSEAAGAAALLTALGVPRDRLILEANARDTYENAVIPQGGARQGSTCSAPARAGC